ncbi:fungal-specific transcription factor domain-containing protein [Dactylonectria macrodidyma]|uniref:Fungal-specific transcription factor domain-containing protein n=1 Tax=Dactylonectria macrodidyma TaxID=307937 RepID=A0A9P9EH61_9HYPO|nr:fungal-specific transcription factor domain-containing protein [Dactylonectria macrodidyma]
MVTRHDDRREVPHRQIANVRKRTKQACDRCSSLRVRCDGRHPCHRCDEYEQNCFYTRNIGKRGRKPRTMPERAQTTILDETQYEDSSDSGQYPDRAQQRLPHPNSQAAQNQSLYQPVTERPNSPHASLSDMATRNRYPNVSAPSTQRLSALLTQHYYAPVLELAASQGQEHHEETGLSHGHDELLPSAGVVDSPTFPQDLPLSFPYGEVLRTRCANPHQHTSPLNPPSDRTQHKSRPSRTFKCIEPILPMLHGIVDEKLACELLEMYFLEPGGSLFRCASPYVLTHVLRKESLLRSDTPRRTTPALLTTMLWVSAQTAQSSLFLRPGQKTQVCEELRKLMLTLIHERDQDSWHRNTAGTLLKYSDRSQTLDDSAIHSFAQSAPLLPSEGPPAPSIDDVLAFVLLTIVLSGGDFKTDCFRWWNKALRLSRAMGLNREDSLVDSTLSPRCTQSSTCACRACDAVRACISVPEVQEERRRVFWLMFCVDRHLALSHNSGLNILDDECNTYCPLPDDEWEFLASPAVIDLSTTRRTYGPPTRVSGTGFFEYFLPLMAILGDIIQLHHRKYHPRFGCGWRDDEQDNDTALVEGIMAECERSIADMATRSEVNSAKYRIRYFFNPTLHWIV